MQTKNTLKRISNIFVSTLFLGVCFGILFLFYIVFIPWPPIPWVLFFAWIIMPLLAALGVCFIINRNNFCFKRKNIDKHSFKQLIGRLLGATIFLLLGYCLESIHLNDYGLKFVSILFNFFFYAIISGFISVFSILECIFVETKTK